ncbi:MAG: efflux RND transporter periplasmic adaptor subunit [Deltaproteobacteria bacterium]|nr:efflux RND transporter periplasmic adaptor subunit [Deltaproteobacteria bacterium]
MNKQKLKVILPFGIISISIILAVIIMLAKPDIEQGAQEIKALQVRVMPAVKKEVQMTVISQGTVRAKTESEIVAQVSGVIKSISESFVVGGFFKKGHILVRLDDRDYQYRLIQAKHKVIQAELVLKLEEQQAEIAYDEWIQMNEGMPPALVSREPQLAEARASLESAKAGLMQTQLDLERTKVRAPFSGRVKSKNVDIGRFVSPGMSLARIYSIDVAEVRLPLPDKDLKYLSLPFDFRNQVNSSSGPEVILSGDFAGNKQQWVGSLSHIEGEFDSRSRMIHVVARVADPYGDQNEAPLTVGMYVHADIVGKKVDGLIEVPRTAIRNQNQLLIVDKENRIHFRNVEIFRIDGEKVFIEGGINDNEWICISQPKTVVDGMRVTPITEEN